MIGRDTELEAILAVFRQVATSAGSPSSPVIAEAGIGKSRLLYEVARSADLEAIGGQVLHGRARPQTESQPYGLLREIVAGSLGLGDDDSLERARSKIERGMAPLFADEGAEPARAHAHLLGQLIGLDFGDSPHIATSATKGRQIRRRGFHAAAQALRRIAARDGKPVVLLLDDLHWSDDGSLDFLSHLVEANADVPTLVLGTARPALLERRPDWPGRSEALRLVLGPLGRTKAIRSPRAAEEARGGAAGAARAPHAEREGNPFYMEELIKMLVDEGAIVIDGERWTLLHDKLQAAACAADPHRRAPGPARQPQAAREAGLAAGGGGRLRVLGPGAGGDRQFRARGAARRRPGASSWSAIPRRASTACANTPFIITCCIR
jgi:predicted ATPase